MTLDLAPIEARAAAASPGPWREGIDGNVRVYGPDARGVHSGLIASFIRRADVKFITHARQDVSALIAEITRLREENARKDAALREAARFLDYFANERTTFVGPGTPKSCLAQITAVLGDGKESE